MSSLSPLRRSPPSIHRLPTIQRLQIRLFSAPATPPQFIDSNFDANFGENENPSGSSTFLRWVSGIVTGSSLGLALYWYFPNSNKSIMNLADWSTPNSTQATIVDDRSSNPKFLFGGNRICLPWLFLLVILILLLLSLFFCMYIHVCTYSQ